MPLYTRCPACRSEIAFEPPKNIAELPEDYKHRIKCPSCGVTIGVRLNVIDRQPVRETPIVLQPIEEPAPALQYEEEQIATVPARNLEKPAKKKGTGRNVIIMIISLLIIALSVVSHLVGKGTIKIDNDYGLAYCDGVGGWELLVNDVDAFKEIFSMLGAANGAFYVMPMFFFALACVTFIIALISTCVKKYGRAINLILAVLTFAVGIIVIFSPYAYIKGISSEAFSLGDYFNLLFGSEKAYCIFSPMAFGFLQFIFSLFFLKSLKKYPEKHRQ